MPVSFQMSFMLSFLIKAFDDLLRNGITIHYQTMAGLAKAFLLGDDQGDAQDVMSATSTVMCGDFINRKLRMDASQIKLITVKLGVTMHSPLKLDYIFPLN